MSEILGTLRRWNVANQCYDYYAEPWANFGNEAQYRRGDKTWQTLNGAAVINTPAGAIAAVTVQAALNELDTEKTTLAAVKADTDIASAISLKHAAVTVSAPISLSGQALSLKNNAATPAAITAIDIGVVDAASDVKVPTSKAVATAIAAMSGGVADGDKGDITVSSSGAAWAIDPAAVTYAKIQNVSAADKILGRVTAGAGSVEEIACTAAGRALIDDATAAAQATTLGLGTTDGPSHAHLYLTDAPATGGALITAAESWIGPSATAGVYFKGGYYGFGTTTPFSALTLGNLPAVGAELTYEAASDAACRRWKLATNRVAWGDFAIQQSTTQYGSTWANKIYISPTGNITIGGALTTSGQIAFPATQNPSADVNTLDDYKENTWTPTVTAFTGTITTLGTVVGTYVKIGAMVFLFFSIRITTNGTGGGYIIVSGLPFNIPTTVVGCGRESANTGKTLAVGYLTATSLACGNYDFTYPATDNGLLLGSASYMV